MKTILLLGAGKSATFLIDYLLENAPKNQWKLQVADVNSTIAKQKIGQSLYGEGIETDITDEQSRKLLISQADLVISLLPPQLHILVARDCLFLGRHLFTASYLDEEVKKLESEIKRKGLFFLYEMGLDPGIDHMSAMELIERIQLDGGNILSFISHCGGLVATHSDNNPWHYKISWNPANVVQAGKSGATYRWKNQNVELSYSELFAENRKVTIQGAEELAWYPNRNSLNYATLYGVNLADTFVRTTIRHPHFIKGWHYLIQLKLTNEQPVFTVEGENFATLFERLLSFNQVEKLFQQIVKQDPLAIDLFNSLGFFDSQNILTRTWYTPALFLQECIERNLKMESMDTDRVIMQHEITFEKKGQTKRLISTLDIEGKDAMHTAMAKTVGLPLALAVTHFLKGEIALTGLQIPTHEKIYKIVLPTLESVGIHFVETETAINF